MELEEIKEILEQALKNIEGYDEQKLDVFLCLELKNICISKRLDEDKYKFILNWFENQKPTEKLHQKVYNGEFYNKLSKKNEPWWSLKSYKGFWFENHKPRIDFLKILIVELEDEIQENISKEPRICCGPMCGNEIEEDKDFCSEKCAKNWMND